jgi:hypothetical protein
MTFSNQRKGRAAEIGFANFHCPANKKKARHSDHREKSVREQSLPIKKASR